MFRAVAVCVVGFVALGGAAGCAARSRPSIVHNPSPTPASGARLVGIELIGELKEFEESLGGHATENFRRMSDRYTSDNRCYFTGKLQLPEFYSHLLMVREDGERCAARSGEYDVFFYPVEAVASGDEAITVSLTQATTERVLVVVPHEDFHNQHEARKAPTEVAEAAATLVGFLTASRFARERLESPAAGSLDRDVDLFLQKSHIVNQYYDQIRALYDELQAGRLTRDEALARKSALFEDLKRSCSQITPDPVSFNKCPAALNNAGLAFDRTYTRYYPMLHDFYQLLGQDPALLVTSLKRLMLNWPATVADAADLMKVSAGER